MIGIYLLTPTLDQLKTKDRNIDDFWVMALFFTPIYKRLISVQGKGIVTFSNEMPRIVTASTGHRDFYVPVTIRLVCLSIPFSYSGVYLVLVYSWFYLVVEGVFTCPTVPGILVVF